MIRVLIVDDSPTLRVLIRNIIESDPELIVVGEAHNGRQAIQRCQELDPDIVTMDIEMPEMDGYQAIQCIMAESPRPIVVLTSTESNIRLGINFKGIDAGALMVIGKPNGPPETDPGARLLTRQIKAMAGVKVVRRRQAPQQKPISGSGPQTGLKDLSGTTKLIAVGVSTGGPPALKTVLEPLPRDFPVPIVIVQHISKGFVQGLARWLDGCLALNVKIAVDRELLQGGSVYLAPDGAHTQVVFNRRIRLEALPPIDGHCPSVTALFNSTARACGASAVGVLLTGMGRDGATGLHDMHAAGAYTIAQDEATSIVFGMPGEGIKLGAARQVLPLERIGPRLNELAVLTKKTGDF